MSDALNSFYVFFVVQRTFRGGFAPAAFNDLPKLRAIIGAIAGSESAIEALMHVNLVLRLEVELHQEGGCRRISFKISAFFCTMLGFILCRYNRCVIYAPHLSACNAQRALQADKCGAFSMECNLTKKAFYAKKPQSTLHFESATLKKMI